MRVDINEDGEEVGWYDTEDNEFEYEGKYPFVEGALRNAASMTEMKQPDIDGPQDVWETVPESWTDADAESVIDQVNKIVNSYGVEIEKPDEFGKAEKSYMFKENGIWKRRIYVDSPQDAPDWATVEEGPDEGLYYETEGPHPAVRDEGEGPPPRLNPGYATDNVTARESVSESNEANSGRYAASMDVLYTERGKIYAKEAEPDHLISETMSDHVLGGLDVNAPGIYYDEEENRVLKEGIEGHSIAHVTGSAGNTPFPAPDAPEPEDIDEDSYAKAVAGMIVTGNDDLTAGNIQIDEDGESWIIDNDNLGARNFEMRPEDAKWIMEAGKDYAKAMDIDVHSFDIQQKVEEIIDNVWDESNDDISEDFINELETAGEHGIESDKNATEAVKENIKTNIEVIARGDMEW